MVSRKAVWLVWMLWIMLGCATARADDLVTRIDGAVERGRHWLIAQQSPDGAWRSHVYGLFKDGPSLTGHVAESLGKSAARDLAIQYLSGLAKDGEPGLIRLPLIYPVYTAADAVMLLPPGQENAAWLKFLREQQLDESLGWRETDLEFGGWSYSLQPPHRPPEGKPRGPWDFSNTSATLYGLWALKSAGVSQSDGAFARALTFICRCQNYSATPNGKYDDGGFFFSPAEPLRNKAGVAGIDSAGRTRFRSYGSATVDGLQILILCGLPGDDPRVRAAVGCLKKWNEVEHNPGEFDPSDEDIRDATYFYYCRGLAQCARYLDDPHVVRRLAETLLLKQRSDGTWANPFNDAKEDDPLVATPLAMEALEDCRGILEGRP